MGETEMPLALLGNSVGSGLLGTTDLRGTYALRRGQSSYFHLYLLDVNNPLEKKSRVCAILI